MRSLDEVVKALEICGNDEPLKCPYFDTEEWRCCDWKGERKLHRKAMMDDAHHYLREYKTLLPLVPSLINTALQIQKKGKTIG